MIKIKVQLPLTPEEERMFKPYNNETVNILGRNYCVTAIEFNGSSSSPPFNYVSVTLECA